MEKINTNCIIGIDPGAAGGIAIYIKDDSGEYTRTIKMPKDIADFGDLFVYYKENYNPIVFLEKLSVRPDDILLDGNRANMGKMYRVQKMMANFEHLKAVIEMANIPFVLVHPMTWQTKLKLRLRGVEEGRAERKRRYKESAAELYPGIGITLWNADALLIMHFGRWALENEPKWIKAQLPERILKTLF